MSQPLEHVEVSRSRAARKGGWLIPLIRVFLSRSRSTSTRPTTSSSCLRFHHFILFIAEAEDFGRGEAIFNRPKHPLHTFALLQRLPLCSCGGPSGVCCARGLEVRRACLAKGRESAAKTGKASDWSVMLMMLQKPLQYIPFETSRYRGEALSGNWLTEWVRQSHSDPTDPFPHPTSYSPRHPTPIPHTVTQRFWTFREARLTGEALASFMWALDGIRSNTSRWWGWWGCSTVSLIESDGMIRQKGRVRESKRNY